ncbi:sigma-70 family RNA polymerase sigma factor [Leifsonia sp. NPDC058230]|uniref:sigma-70 family RNA polymerase sigma factor n=1 Tax=Leifsonia sp. NPDC058230 TaxID=3346391 RepID=UPI0036DE3759
MSDIDVLAARFEEHRTRLRAVGYRMLGSFSDADDAVQEAWLRVSRSDAGAVENLGGWLTTVVSRVCLNMLRSRASRRESALPEHPVPVHTPDPVVSRVTGGDPEHEALVADAVGLALLVVLDTLTPAERLSFVLHDTFGVAFDEIAEILDGTAANARQLASRARKRVSSAPTPDPDLARQRQVVDAFFAAAREGDFEALIGVLAPDVVLRSDGGSGRPVATEIIRGATALARQAVTWGQLSPFAHPALVNGAAGVVVAPKKQPVSIMAFVVQNGRIAAVDVLADPERLRTLELGDWAV